MNAPPESPRGALLAMIREVCALGRAEFERPRTPRGDAGAQRALVEGLHALDGDGRPSDISLSLPLLAPRAPYVDRRVLDAIGAGVGQIVGLGAGYDDRALRFRTPGTTFFELDLADVVADKSTRLARMGADPTGPRLAAIDFDRDDVARVLAGAGHDPDRPTLFLAEHLALFLRPDSVRRLLTGIARRAAAGSTLVLSIETHPAGLDPTDVVAAADAEMFGGAGPVHTISSLPRWLSLLDDAGWHVGDDPPVVVDHFAFPLAGHTVAIRTRFVTASIDAGPVG